MGEVEHLKDTALQLPYNTEVQTAVEKLRSAVGTQPELSTALATVVSALQKAQEHAVSEQRLRRNHAALMTVARSEALSQGDLPAALRELTETASQVLGVARSSVWLYNADQTSIQCIDLFVREQGTHESGIELPESSYPGYFKALGSERTIAARDAHTDERTREFSEGYLRPLGIGAMLDAPIRVGGRMIGVLCNEHIGDARAWAVDEEQFAGSVADLIALAMESNQRRETEEQLREMVKALEE